VDVKDLDLDFLSVAGHKLYAPKGVGVLYAKYIDTLTPLIHGAGQEFGKRAGTENVILAVGLGAACRIAQTGMKNNFEKMTRLRNRLEERLFGNIEGLVLNGHPAKRLPNTLNVSVPGLEGAKILEGLPEIMASTGAACHDRSVTLSHVLSAMHVPLRVGMGAIRLSVGRSNTMDQMEEAAEQIINQVKRMRNEK
jgi:cysteine desulfurase